MIIDIQYYVGETTDYAHLFVTMKTNLNVKDNERELNFNSKEDTVLQLKCFNSFTI